MLFYLNNLLEIKIHQHSNQIKHKRNKLANIRKKRILKPAEMMQFFSLIIISGSFIFGKFYIGSAYALIETEPDHHVVVSIRGHQTTLKKNKRLA